MPAIQRRRTFKAPFSQTSQLSAHCKKQCNADKTRITPATSSEQTVSPLRLSRIQIVTPKTKSKIKERFACGLFQNVGQQNLHETSPGIYAPFEFSQSEPVNGTQDLESEINKSDVPISVNLLAVEDEDDSGNNGNLKLAEQKNNVAISENGHKEQTAFVPIINTDITNAGFEKVVVEDGSSEFGEEFDLGLSDVDEMEQRDCDVGKKIAAQNSASQTCTKGEIKGLGEVQKGTDLRKTNTADTILNRYISVAKNKEKVNREHGIAKRRSKGEKHKQRKDNTEDNGIMNPSDYIYKISRSDSSNQPAKRKNRKRCHRKSKCFREMVRCSVLKTLAMMHIEIQRLQNRRHKLQANGTP